MYLYVCVLIVAGEGDVAYTHESILGMSCRPLRLAASLGYVCMYLWQLSDSN